LLPGHRKLTDPPDIEKIADVNTMISMLVASVMLRIRVERGDKSRRLTFTPA